MGFIVNTAARMESNGVKGRIHMSQATADALAARGKGHWITARDEKIEAKGKGKMQTYFISTNFASQSVRSIVTTEERSEDGAWPDATKISQE